MKEPNVAPGDWDVMMSEDRITYKTDVDSVVIRPEKTGEHPKRIARPVTSEIPEDTILPTLRMMASAKMLCEAIIDAARRRAAEDWCLLDEGYRKPRLDHDKWCDVHWPMYLNEKERQALIAAGYEQ